MLTAADFRFQLATTQREQQFTCMCFVEWLAENLSVEKDSGIGSNNETMSNFW